VYIKRSASAPVLCVSDPNRGSAYEIQSDPENDRIKQLANRLMTNSSDSAGSEEEYFSHLKVQFLSATGSPIQFPDTSESSED